MGDNMITYDEAGNVITEFDLTQGTIEQVCTIKEDATPPDNVTKFAYESDDYVSYCIYHPFTDEERARRESEISMQKFLNSGPTQLESNTTSIEDLTILVSDMIGGESE